MTLAIGYADVQWIQVLHIRWAIPAHSKLIKLTGLLIGCLTVSPGSSICSSRYLSLFSIKANIHELFYLFLILNKLPGETSRTPLSPALTDAERGDRGKHLRSDVCMDMEGDDMGEGGEGGEGEPPRLQRCKAQSRNTFRLRRSRRNRVEVGCNNTNICPMR